MWWPRKGRTAIPRNMMLRGAVVVVLLLGTMSIPIGNAQANGCANEVLRSELRSGQLPDCRAYELVSSGYKEGAIISGVFAISQDGQHLIGNSFGVFGGAQSDGLGQGTSLLGSTYLFSRQNQTGWTATSLDPPNPRFRSNGMFDSSADLTSSLWELGRRKISPSGAAPEEALCTLGEGEEAQVEGVTDFYVEAPINTFTKIGPATPEPCTVNANRYRYLGASGNLSHVLYSAGPGFRWPFDETALGGGTLYEYVGTGHSQPMLVGVSGGRESTALISHCGTRLGSSSPEENIKGSVYNAIAASGTRVFFTSVGADESGCGSEAPPVGELFAREELPGAEGELPAAVWRTVPISEPSSEDCSACSTTSELRDATFQGASEDGSKVFFTTEQELLPGVAGENLYEYDFEAAKGSRLALVSGGSANTELRGVTRVSEDGTRVYFVAGGVLTGSSTNNVGSTALGGADNLYMYERDAALPAGHIAFIATLSSMDSVEWQGPDERPVLASHDGRFLVFGSVADLTHEGTGGRSQVFQYDAATGGLVRASVGENGFNDNNRFALEGAMVRGMIGYTTVDSPAAANGSQAPADGAVFFQSPDGLTPKALSDHLDAKGEAIPNVYEYKTGSVYLLSDGQDVSVVDTFPSVSLFGSDPSGGDTFFFTADSLTANDDDTQQDIYDVRADGGFSMSTPTPNCSGEACRGPLSPAPALAQLGGSATQEAEAANQTTSALSPGKTGIKKKPKGKGKRKTRVKKKAGKSARLRRRDETRAR
jgi:hypothetical protein